MTEAPKSAYILVIGQVKDGKKLAEYQAALTASGLYPANEGSYLVCGRPVEVLEGDPWESDRAVVIAKFPPADHARSFWNSDAYQKDIKPLRSGAGDFTVALLEGPLGNDA